MKKLLAVSGCMLLSLSLFSQDKINENVPAGMVFVPAGSFEMEMSLNSEKKPRHVTVDAFWMSNEITNGEFKEFIDWAKNNPEKKLYRIKYSSEIITDPNQGSTKDTIIKVTTTIDASTILSDFTGAFYPENLSTDFTTYFTDKKFVNYPVVGVSFKMAECYCIWRTDRENEKMKANGLPNVHSYRIPLETEWQYAAIQPLVSIGSYPKLRSVQAVDEGDVNEWGLYHLTNNVSELVVQNTDGKSIVKGGSWKTKPDLFERQVCDPDFKASNIGFRVVRSYLYGKK